MKSRTKQLGLALLCILVWSLPAHAKKPNVLFIAVDDMNDWVGCLGDTPRAKTPNINKLAAAGVNFTNAHTAGTYCAPSRAAIFTGQYASTTGCYKYQVYHGLYPEKVPLHLSFVNAGYDAYGAGKLFHHQDGHIDPRGWKEFFLRKDSQRKSGWPLETWSDEMPFPPQGTKDNSSKAAYDKKGKRKWGMLPNDKEGEMADSIRTSWVISKLKEKHDKPFFIGLGLYSPHLPNYCPKKYYDLYDRETIPMPVLKADDPEDLPEPMRTKMMKRVKVYQKMYIDSGLQKESIHSYLACISYADAQVGRILDALKASPYAKDTIVVLWSDNGFHYGEKGHFGKKEMWQRSSQVPLVWSGPGIAKGQKVDATVSLIDMYPTLVDLCGLAAPKQELEGTSLASILSEPAQAKDRDVFLPYIEPNAFTIINREWRYIKYADDTEELYAVQKDPNEWDNLAENPEYAAIKKKLKAKGPETFAPQAAQHNAKSHLVIEGDSYHWKEAKLRKGRKNNKKKKQK